MGWTASRLLFHDEADDRMVAAASVLLRQLPRLPAAIAYVPKGPAFDYGDASLADTVLASLEVEARRSRVVFIKIDPDVPSESEQGSALMDLLRRRGWRSSLEQIQYRNTILSDLVPDEEALMSSMKSKTRYNIRLAARRGVSVRHGTTADLAAFYDMYRETALRDGFIIRPFEYYRQAWESFLSASMARLLLADVEGATIAGLLLFTFADRAWYMYGASTTSHRQLMPNHLLQWEAIRWAKAQGCTTYDWWGAPDVLNDSDPMWGVYRFKIGFGGQFTPWIGAWDYPTSPMLYWLYSVVMPRVLGLMRRRHNPLA